MLLKRELVLAYLEEHQKLSGREIAGLLRHLSPTDPMVAKDENRARDEELKKLRRLKDYLRGYAERVTKQMQALSAELD